METPSKLLLRKGPSIFVTARCPYKCGGCNQFCDILPKDKIWTISIEQLLQNIDYLKQWYNTIHLFGGEPTAHPEWKKIREILTTQYPKNVFEVSTMSVPSNRGEGNLSFMSGRRHKKTQNNIFVPTLVAPIDIFKNRDPNWYWEQAQRECYIWRTVSCHPIVYNNKAYFCQNAAAFDNLLGMDHGWPLEEGKNPFVKTDEEIAKQASHFCYRCGSCMLLGPRVPLQHLEGKSLISITNHKKLPEHSKKHTSPVFTRHKIYL